MLVGKQRLPSVPLPLSTSGCALCPRARFTAPASIVPIPKAANSDVNGSGIEVSAMTLFTILMDSELTVNPGSTLKTGTPNAGPNVWEPKVPDTCLGCVAAAGRRRRVHRQAQELRNPGLDLNFGKRDHAAEAKLLHESGCLPLAAKLPAQSAKTIASTRFVRASAVPRIGLHNCGFDVVDVD